MINAIIFDETKVKKCFTYNQLINPDIFITISPTKLELNRFIIGRNLTGDYNIIKQFIYRTSLERTDEEYYVFPVRVIINIENIKNHDDEFFQKIIEFLQVHNDRENEVKKIMQNYKHIISTSRTLSEVYDMVPELRDGIHLILNKIKCDSLTSDEDQVMREILEFRRKNKIQV